MMDRSTRLGFYDVLSAAVADITEHGFDTAGRLEYWTTLLREAAERATTPVWRMEEMLRAGFGAIYRRLVDRGGVACYHPDVDTNSRCKGSPPGCGLSWIGVFSHRPT